VVGTPLLALFLLWVAGRVVVFFSRYTGVPIAAAVDLLFLAALGSIIAREIIAGSNWRNLKVLGGVALLFVGNGLFHLEAIVGVGNGAGTRLGIAATVLLITLIGGRIVPSFTRNWLVRRDAGRLPASFDRFDASTMGVTALALVSWIVMPDGVATALLALVAGAFNAMRLYRWAGERTAAEPLVLILHIGYAFVPIGFVLLALAILRPELVAGSGAVHGWTAGAIGLMTLAVMTRASLGHTGRPLTASTPIRLIYVAGLVAALARIVAAFGLLREATLYVSATAWVLAFAGFVLVYAPLLARRRA
jgi:uncharacterized protein involved in response to NO